MSSKLADGRERNCQAFCLSGLRLANLLLRRFKSKETAMNASRDELRKALELALAGKWDAAHDLVQQYESDATASWIHAVLHKIEGDLGNAQYWYRRAGRIEHAEDEPRAELVTIHAELQADRD